jgi:hypothetical protein
VGFKNQFPPNYFCIPFGQKMSLDKKQDLNPTCNSVRNPNQVFNFVQGQLFSTKRNSNEIWRELVLKPRLDGTISQESWYCTCIYSKINTIEFP